MQNILKKIDNVMLEIKTPIRKAIDLAHSWLPTFIYMDDYKIFQGSAHLDQIKDRRDRNQATEADYTIIQIMEMAGLELDEEVKKGKEDDREQRILDMNDASQTLTEEIENRWSQKKYEVVFQVDGQHFITFVKDADSKVLVPLEERSKGFQWFFSFDMTFMYETKGEFENAIILLDEPGLHLHAAAQRDLLKRLKAYSRYNQLIYSTHLPFMIDSSRLDNIYVAEDQGKEGTKIHQDWLSADSDARFTLQAALGLSWSQSLYVGQYNLIVEGVTDYWFLTTISTMLQEAGREGLNDKLVITPAGGATKAAYIGTILKGQELNVAVLLDSDREGQTAYEQLVHNWIVEKKQVLMLGQILGVKHSCANEDLFSEDYYVEQVRHTYRKELSGNELVDLGPAKNQPIVDRVEIALRELGIEKFNKGRVAKQIMSDLATKSIEDLPTETVARFEAVISAINGLFEEWGEIDSKKRTKVPNR